MGAARVKRVRRTSTRGRDYVLHVKRGGWTLCNRVASSVNCAGEEDEHKLDEDSGCRICLAALQRTKK